MKIYVDADACPRPIKDILFKAAIRTRCSLILVANQRLSIPKSAFITTIQVASGFDQADDYIIKAAMAGDLVITADILLADEIISKHALALTPRGDIFTQENIKQRLAVRNIMDNLRTSGIQTGGPATMSPRDVQHFANALDRYLRIHS
jgi:uncharacterized protein